MDSTGWDFLKEGFLDVKAPPDSPERLLHKAWRRLWVSFIVFRPAGRGEPHLVAHLSRKKEDDHVKQVKASRDGLRLFRCKSTSRDLRAWALSSGSSLLVYLAAESEEQTQQWMQVVRDGLWPPVNTPQVLTESNHEVSLIDDEKSFTSGLLGVYGRLVKTSDDVLSVVHPHWQGVQMRWRLDDILDVCLVRRTGREDSSSGVFLLIMRSTKKQTRSLQFYSTTVVATIDWVRFLLEQTKDPPKETGHTYPIQRRNSETISDIIESIQCATQDKPGPEDKHVPPSNVYGKVKHLRATLEDIPDAFLDSSINSQMFERRETGSSSSSTDNEANGGHQQCTEDSEESLAQLYDHIYDDLDSVKNGRSYTVYEEIDDGAEEEYVPPLPPTLPPTLVKQSPNGFQRSRLDQPKVDRNAIEKPSTLRLQKLCESVSEALKMADDVVPVVKEPRPSLFRKMVGKSKSHHSSPVLEHAPTNILPNTSPTFKRAVSESNIARTQRCDKNLPLLPFNYVNDDKSGYLSDGDSQNRLPLEYLLKSSKKEDNSGNLSKKSVKCEKTLESVKASLVEEGLTKSNLKPFPSALLETEYLNMR